MVLRCSLPWLGLVGFDGLDMFWQKLRLCVVLRPKVGVKGFDGWLVGSENDSG